MKATITLKELLEAVLAQTRDENAEIFVDGGDLDFYEVRLRTVLPADGEHPPVIWLEMGQVWNEERNIDNRIDRWHETT
jgi:hypothetical protein